jgi:hypothetical protein
MRRTIPEIIRKLRGHPELGKRLVWLEGISDEYLEKVYAAGACLMAASYGEGFGLPLIEAARHKLPIIARDISVFREVAGERAFYFKGNDPEALAYAIEEWLALRDRNSHPKSDDMPWLTWKESAATLFQCLLEEDYRLNERSSRALNLSEDSQKDYPVAEAPRMRQNASGSGSESVNQLTGYEYARFDGLTRYFVAGANGSLKAAFKAAPDVFDDSVRSEHPESESPARESEAKVKEVEQRASQAEARIREAETKARQAEKVAAQAEERLALAEITARRVEEQVVQAKAATRDAWKQANEWRGRALALQNSASWKITAPLRALNRIVRRQSTAAEIFTAGIVKLKQFTRARLVSTVRWAGARARTAPNLKRFALWLLRARPGLQEKLSGVYLRSQCEDPPQPVNWFETSADSVRPLEVDVSGAQECVTSQPAPRGVNADQRTPLESSFHSYSGKL